MKLGPSLTLLSAVLPLACFNPDPPAEDEGSTGADSGTVGSDTQSPADSGTAEGPATEGPSTGDPSDPCDPDPCQNGGTCAAEDDAAVCTCPPGYGGDQCEEDPCDPNPCAHAGTCTVDASGAVCECADGYEGDLCETEIDECADGPCLNGGVCVDEVAGFSCMCPGGFEGDACEVNIDDCAPNPCLNGGTCIDGVEAFACDCNPPYQGDLCECEVGSMLEINYTTMGTFVAPALYNAPVSVTGSASINVLNLNGLGIVGGANSNTIDGMEFIEFSFDSPSVNTSYFVNSAGNLNGDGFVGSAFVEAFDENDLSLGVAPVNGTGAFDMAALFGAGNLVSRFVVTANVDSHRISRVNVRPLVCI